MEAVGMMEMYGFVCAIKAADAAAKAADVKVIAIDSNKPANAETVEVPLIMCVKVQGSVSAVRAAIEAGSSAAKACTGLITTHIIPRPTKDAERMALRSSVGRERVGHIQNNA